VKKLALDQTEAFYLCKQSRLNHKLDPHHIIQHDNLSKIGPLWSLVPKGEKMLFTKIDSKGGENPKGKIDKRRGSTNN
jgi:hypothetical protein